MGTFNDNMYTNPGSNQAMYRSPWYTTGSSGYSETPQIGQAGQAAGGESDPYAGNSYFEMLLKGIMDTGEYGPTQDAAARGKASEQEDAMLRYKMGSKRKKGKHEQIPDGSLALSNYPGLRNAVDWAATGNMPSGVGSGSAHGWLKEQNDREYGDRMRQGRKDWAQNQKDALGWRY